MLIEQLLKSNLECQMKEIEKHLHSSFDKINNFIDQVFNLDQQTSIISSHGSELSLPKVNEFNLVGQSNFQSNMVQELMLLVNQKIKSQPQMEQDLKFKTPSQYNLKPFSYQIIQDNSIKQQNFCGAFAFNKDCSIIAVGCGNEILIYEFEQGKFKQTQVLVQHQNSIFTLNFMKKSNQLISGDCDNAILIWSISNKNQWVCLQTVQGHDSQINCLVVHKNEDLFISGSNDKTIKFWVKENEWKCSQTITYHQNSVYSLSLNEKQNQVISCGGDKFILITQYSEQTRNWVIIQQIDIDYFGIRLHFINNNTFTFQSQQGSMMQVYEMDSEYRIFTKTKEIILNQGDDSNILFPQLYVKSKQLLINKNNKYVNFIRMTEYGEFKLEQSIQFAKNGIYGSLSDDGDYLITWDYSSYEIQIRKYQEE
ncbi:unnamed protein product [Paramecium octaurelia]|uniref:WD domain, G-beta repeat protein n=1 Tax=Paramecium octaurelia TaxID=43137 RepID=A0A8S1T542_PAROT|nr:unnamed protein product [Paramecium octaurelia]